MADSNVVEYLYRRFRNTWRKGPTTFLTTRSLRVLPAIQTIFYRYPTGGEWKEGDLRYFEESVLSQNGEDGILREILKRLGIARGVFFEIGAEFGTECNCARLARQEGWRGIFVEGSERSFELLSANYADLSDVTCINAWVTADNVESLLAANAVPRDLDLLTIDIDGNDYWVWQAIERWHPTVIVTEFNSSFPPPMRWVMERDDNHSWDGTSYFGASLASFDDLAQRKGYRLVCTDSKGVNAFFVRSDAFGSGLFLDEDIEYHYSPPRYGFFGHGHRRVDGPHHEI